jgi:ATP-dependent helicase/nuclease subunit B
MKKAFMCAIDYKSGNRALKLSDVYYGLQLQLVTYMDAVLGIEQEADTRSSDGKAYLPGGVLYVRLDDPLIGAPRESTPEEIEKAIMKELKMKGLLLADVKLVKEMDRQIDGDSLIIPARLNKGDTLGRSSAISKEQFENLRLHVRNTLISLGSQMLSGNVRISPYKKKAVTACKYCVYSSVCQFDPSMHDNKYRILSEIGDDEVLKLISGDAP